MSEGPPAAVLPLLQEADRILAESADLGLGLQWRSPARSQHCQRCCAGVAALDRDLPRDLDFFAYRKQQRELGRMCWKARARVGTACAGMKMLGDAEQQGQGDAGLH